MKNRNKSPFLFLLGLALFGFPLLSSQDSSGVMMFSALGPQAASPTILPTAASTPTSDMGYSLFLPLVSSQPGPPTLAYPLPEAAPGEAIILAAGDIADCSSDGDEQTAALLQGLEGTVLVLGDEVYPDGTAQEFADCYAPSWGQFKFRTFPTPGNHEYKEDDAAGYFSYFGPVAGDPTKGYYSFDLGSWHIVSLNSYCQAIGGCNAGSPEELWLRADLAAHPSQCTLAFWHHPLFGSGSEGSTSRMKELWQALYDNRVDVVVNGHNHIYERFAPQDPNGVADPVSGITEFIAGTGGKDHAEIRTPLPNSLVRDNTSFGVLRMVLKPGGYSWQFIPVAGATFTDSGEAACH